MGLAYSKSPNTAFARITIKNCANTGDVSTSEDAYPPTANVGGIVGRVSSSGSNAISIEGCYNTGAVSAFAAAFESETAVAAAGGLVGSAVGVSGSIAVKNCYNTGAVTANCEGDGKTTSYAGAVIGQRAEDVTGTFRGLYYLLPSEGTATVASGDGSAIDGATEKSANEFASGEVCYLLNGNKSSGQLFWYQTLGVGGDPSPVLDSTHGFL